MKKGTFTRKRQQQSNLFLQSDGFTLIELLMVVIILGILAAVVIPQFTSSSDDAKVSALKSNLSSMRGALELYLVQHESKYPDADPNKFTAQLTQYTDQSGNTSTQKDDVYKYGPYLKQGLPKNPFAKTELADRIAVDTTKTIGTVAADTDPNRPGWKYAPNTGEFIANTNGYGEY